MILTEYRTEFTSDEGIQYQIAIRIPNTNFPYSDFGVGVFQYAPTNYLFDRSIIDITDLNWEFEDFCAEVPKTTACKVKFNLDFLPDAILNAFENKIDTYDITVMDKITVNIPPSYLVIRKAVYSGGDFIPTYDDDGNIIGYTQNPRVFSHYKTIAYLAKTAQSESTFDGGNEYEVEFLDLGKSILENITFDVINQNLENGAIKSNYYIDTIFGTNKKVFTKVDNDDFKFVWQNLQEYHNFIYQYYLMIWNFHLGKDFTLAVHALDVNFPMLFYKQVNNHAIGAQLDFNLINFIGFIINTSDNNLVVGGRLSANEDEGFSKKYQNAYNYFKALAIQTRSKLIINIDENQTGFNTYNTVCSYNLEYLYSSDVNYLTINTDYVYKYSRTRKMPNRYKMISSNIDNLDNDKEDIELSNNLSDNAQSLEMEMLWNSRPHSNDYEYKDSTDSYYNVLDKRMTDLMYSNSSDLNNVEMIRTHESIGIYLGSIKLENGTIIERKMYNYDYDDNRYFDLLDGNIVNSATAFYMQDYAIARASCNAGLRSIPGYFYTIETTIGNCETRLNNSVLNEFDFARQSASIPMYKLITNLKRLDTSENVYYWLMGVNVKSLKSGRIELKFARGF